ncbi:DUF3105 domain-containing protein [Williamsia sp. SKLECPSW1]
MSSPHDAAKPDETASTTGAGTPPGAPKGSTKPPKKKSRPGTIPATAAGRRRSIPWATLAAVVVVIAVAGGIAAYLVPKYTVREEAQKFVPSASNPDPSDAIPGVVKQFYPAGQHVSPAQRVAYDRSPPFGGPHDAVWATCTGVVYPNPLRTENAVHSLEHGAVWIAYNPQTVSAADTATLERKVSGRQFMLMSPYPGLDEPISLQSWGHQLKVSSASDPRIDQFITALRLNAQTNVYPGQPRQTSFPEVGASCAAIPGSFDPNNPPAADVGPVPANAVPMNGAGTQQATDEPGVAPAPAG